MLAHGSVTVLASCECPRGGARWATPPWHSDRTGSARGLAHCSAGSVGGRARSLGAHRRDRGVVRRAADAPHPGRGRSPRSEPVWAPHPVGRWAPSLRASACHTQRSAGPSPWSVPSAAAWSAEATAPAGAATGRVSSPSGTPGSPAAPRRPASPSCGEAGGRPMAARPLEDDDVAPLEGAALDAAADLLHTADATAPARPPPRWRLLKKRWPPSLRHRADAMPADATRLPWLTQGSTAPVAPHQHRAACQRMAPRGVPWPPGRHREALSPLGSGCPHSSLWSPRPSQEGVSERGSTRVHPVPGLSKHRFADVPSA